MAFCWMSMALERPWTANFLATGEPTVSAEQTVSGTPDEQPGQFPVPTDPAEETVKSCMAPLDQSYKYYTTNIQR